MNHYCSRIRRSSCFCGHIAIGAVLCLTGVLQPFRSFGESASKIAAGANTTPRSLSANDCGNAWTIVSSPNFGSGNNELYDVGFISASDAWAVGRYSDASGYKTLAM